MELISTNKMRRLKKLEQDIFDLLTKKEPSMLLWREVVNPLWPIYQEKHRKGGKKSFGVVVSRNLKQLEDLRLIKQEGNYWGTLDSSPPTEQKTSYWSRLKHNFEQVSGNSVEIRVQRALYAGRNPETGWRVYDYEIESSIEGIMVLKDAVELVATARSAEIYIGNEYDGIVLTSDPIGYKYRLSWKGRLYEVKNVEERYDGYNFSHRIAYLDERILDRDGKETVYTYAPNMVSDGRSQTRVFLTTYLTDANIAKDDGITEAAYAVIYADPDYDIMNEEFQASVDPVDGLYAIGESETMPLLDPIRREPYAYEERVPIFVSTINKREAGVTGIKLKWAMEAELRRICETHPNGVYRTLQRIGDNDKRRGSTMLYSTEFVLKYRRDAQRRES